MLIIPLALILLIALPVPGTALAQEASPQRALPDVIPRGETFNVTVTFTSPSDDFHALSLTEHAPDGWNVAAAASWCRPKANKVKVTDNKVEIAWNGPYQEGVSFTAVYEVTVPGDALWGIYSFDGHFCYWIGATNLTEKSVTGDNETEVVVPEIAVNPLSLAFDAGLGGLTPGNQTLFIWNSGKSGTTLNWALSDNADWLGVNVTSGSSTGEDDKTPVGVSVNITGMSAGDYSATITVADPEAINSPELIPVTLHISAPEINVTPPSLAFGAVQGGLTPGNQTLFIWNSGDIGTRLNWALSDDADWLEENATTGNSTAEDDKTAVGVSVNITGKSAGDYYANIVVTDPEAVNSPELIPVTLHISPPSSGGGGGGGGGKPEIVRGDLNGDVVVDERDLTLLKEIILGLEDGTENADLNGDGKINALDVTMIKRVILGID